MATQTKTEKLNLRVLKREQIGKNVKQVRQEGFIPAVVYGYDMPSTPVSVERESFDHVFKLAGENTLVELSVEGESPFSVLVYDVATDPLTGKAMHVDFYKVRLDEKIETEVPLVFEGISRAVKEMGGTLVKTLSELTVECLPQDLPHELIVDVSGLKTFNDQIKVSDIDVPPAVTIKTDPDEVAALVTPPRTEEEMEALESEVVEDIEGVEGVEKEEEEEEMRERAEGEGEKESEKKSDEEGENKENKKEE